MFIVSVQDPRKEREYVPSDRDARRAYLVRSAPEQHAAMLEDNDGANMAVYNVDDLASAQSLCHYLVKRHPGVNILLSEVQSLFTSEAPTVIEKKVSSKGILPV